MKRKYEIMTPENETKEVSDAYQQIIPLIRDWIRFTGYFNNVPGVSIAIQQYDETLLLDAFGKANLETGEPLTINTLFRIASHSKLFTTTAIMELYAQDLISLDDRVTKYIDWFEPEDDNIRIYHLLTHSAGITRDSTFGQWYHHNFPSNEEFKTIIKEGVEILDPSVQIKYSNIAYSLLGNIIENITGQSYEEYMLDLVNRLGLKFTYPKLTDNELNHATGHSFVMPHEERTLFEHVEAHAMNPATGFSSTPQDLIKFLRAQMPDIDRGLEYGNYVKREMQRVQFKYKQDERGYGFGINTIDKLSFIGHSGGYPGFITYSAMNTDKELAISIFTNTLQPPLMQMFAGVVKLFNYAEKEYDNYDDKDRNLEKYVGLYRSRWGVYSVIQFNQQLILMPLNFLEPVPSIQRLKYEDEHVFIVDEAPAGSFKGEKVKFAFTDEGTELHLGGTVMKSYSYDY